jgi:hypothetical protein
MMQPADVSLQHVVKHKLTQQKLQWFLDDHAQQCAAGKSPELRGGYFHIFLTSWQFFVM